MTLISNQVADLIAQIRIRKKCIKKLNIEPNTKIIFKSEIRKNRKIYIYTIFK